MKFRSCCVSVRTFAVWVGLLGFVKIFAGAYTKSVLTTIERRFQLSSTTSALIATSAQIGNLSVMLFVGYFGQRFNRPRMIGIGCLVITAGYLLCGLPQFIGGRYKFDDISINTSYQGSDQRQSITCDLHSPTTAITEEKCDADDTDAASSSNLYILIVIGVMLAGVGDAPLFPLGFAYVDDHASSHNAAAYIGIIQTIALVGPIVGFVGGAAVLKIYVDIGWVNEDSITIDPHHPGWVGAWWLGFYIAAAAMLVSSLPVWFYPKTMTKETEKQEKGLSDEEIQEGEIDFKDSYKQDQAVNDWSGFLIATKKLLYNPKYLLLVGSWICECFKISGVVTFMVKYLEVGFGKTAAEASFLVGAVNFPFLVVGTMLGALAIKRFKLGVMANIRLVLATYVVTLVAFAALIVIGCGPNDFAGLTVPYPNSDYETSKGTTTAECNSACNCNPDVYTPVCGPGQITYQSPCIAGCSDSVYDESSNAQNYTLCSCVAQSPHEQVVTVGKCYESKCEGLAWVVIGVTSLTNFVAGLAATPLMMLVMRTLGPKEKSFGLSVAFFVYRLLGWIPAPIVFGYAIDQTCLLWTQQTCSERSYCRLYDADSFRTSFGGLLVAVKILSLCFIIALYRFVIGEEKKKQLDDEEKVNSSPELQALSTTSQEKEEDQEKETVI